MSGRPQKLKAEHAKGSRSIISMWESLSNSRNSTASEKSPTEKRDLISHENEPSSPAVNISILPTHTESEKDKEAFDNSTPIPKCKLITDVSESEPITGKFELYKGLTTDLHRLLSMKNKIFKATKAKDKLGKMRLIVTCMICKEHEHEVRTLAANGVVYLASGVRVEGKTGARRFIDNLHSDHHNRAQEINKMTVLLETQSDNHPWVNVMKKHKVETVRSLIKMAMDVYNDTKCETVSARSWPSRSLTSNFSDSMIAQFTESWDAPFVPFVPTSSQMHYCHPNIYLEMLQCIAETIQDEVKSVLSNASAIGLQVDGSSDRQQLMMKFVTCRVVLDDSLKTLFLSATEVNRRGAEGLLEAVGLSLTKPATCNDGESDQCVPVVEQFDFKSKIFSKVRSLSTDGENANTGKRGGLWTKLQEALGRKLICQWCICHRSDLVWNDLINNMSEVRIWWMNMKDAVSFFRCSPHRCGEVKKYMETNSETFKNFVNPPEVRMAQHLLQMCLALIGNMNGCFHVWSEMKINGEREERSKGRGFLSTWKKDGINCKLNFVMTDLLRILSTTQKRFQEEQLTILDIRAITKSTLSKLAAMEENPYPGGYEEKNDTSRSQAEDSPCEPPQKRRKLNAYVPTRTSFSAIRQEVILTIKNMFEVRLADEQEEILRQINEFVASTEIGQMYRNSRKLAEKLLDEQSLQVLYDDICDMFAAGDETLSLKPMDSELNNRFWIIRKFSRPQSSLRKVCDAILTATPHSMMVERVISHYNSFRSAHRLSMTPQGTANRLSIALNGPTTSKFDPRPAVAKFLLKKERRFREPSFGNFAKRDCLAHFFDF